jgi:hypothetical protein
MSAEVINIWAWKKNRERMRTKTQLCRCVFGFDYYVTLNELNAMAQALIDAGRGDIAAHIQEHAVVVVEDHERQ